MTSCARQGIKAESSHNPQATELQKKQEAKPNPSGLKREGYVPGEILVKLYNRFAILYPGAGLRRLKKRKFLYNKVQGWHKKNNP